MAWRRWVIDVPAKAVDVWFLGYRLLLTGMTIVCVTGVVLMLVLWFGFGIRWGW